MHGLLSHGANANSENFQGENALHLLSRFGGECDSQEDGVSIAQELLVRGVDVNAQCKRHRTPLHLASYHGRSAIARVLLDHGAKPNAEDDNGETPLHLLSQGKDYSHEDGVRVARLLIACGANINARDMEHRTPLHHASYNGILAIARVLLEHGGKPNVGDKNSKTPLHLAVRGKYVNFTGFYDSSIDLTRVLLKHGADVDAQDDDHKTPLDLSGWANITKILREHSAKFLYLRHVDVEHSDAGKTRESSHTEDLSPEVPNKRIRLDPSNNFAEVRGENSPNDRMEL